MSFYHLSVGIIGRGNGRSAVACAAYRAGATLIDDRYGIIHDYSPRRGIAETGILAPEEAPDWVHDRERLWNSVEAREKRKDAQLSREFEISFPDGLNQEQRKELLETFLREQITDRGLVADWAIHRPSSKGDNRNWHAHVMTSLRPVSPDGFDAMKDRELNRSEQLIEWRAAWAEIQNEAFERYDMRDENGEVRKVDHRSYEARGMNKEATVHLGPHATAMERRGLSTELGEMNRAIKARNADYGLSSERRDESEERRQQIIRLLEEQRERQNANDNTPEP